MRSISFAIFLIFSFGNVSAQFAPQVGEDSSTAISADDPSFINWAKTCTVERGPLNIADPDSPLASAGIPEVTTGISNSSTLSLGDGGIATLTFEPAIKDGEGFDFAVFENGFAAPDGDFLELAFVEVSSDGLNFVRFSATSLTDDSNDIGGFGYLAATQLHNLAGKYYAGYGTPFDLSELANQTNLDVNNITHVRIVDVIGTAADEFASLDAEENKVIDPYPTAFPAGGFDLDAIGVIHQQTGTSIEGTINDNALTVFPNPVLFQEKIEIKTNYSGQIETHLFDANGRLNGKFSGKEIPLNHLPKGVYFLKIQLEDKIITKRIVLC